MPYWNCQLISNLEIYMEKVIYIVREVTLNLGNELDPKMPLYFIQNSTTDSLKVQQYLHSIQLNFSLLSTMCCHNLFSAGLYQDFRLNALLKVPNNLEPWNLFWKSYVKLHSNKKLDPKSVLCFLWIVRAVSVASTGVCGTKDTTYVNKEEKWQQFHLF